LTTPFHNALSFRQPWTAPHTQACFPPLFSQRVFHPSDVTPAARAAKESVRRYAVDAAIGAPTTEWRSETKGGRPVSFRSGAAWETPEQVQADRHAHELDARARQAAQTAAADATIAEVRARAAHARAVRATDTMGASLRPETQQQVLADAALRRAVADAAAGVRSHDWNASTFFDRRVTAINNVFGASAAAATTAARDTAALAGPGAASSLSLGGEHRFLGPAAPRGVLDATRNDLPYVRPTAVAGADAVSLVSRHAAAVDAQRAARRDAAAATAAATEAARVARLAERDISALLPLPYGGRSKEEEAARRAEAARRLEQTYTREAAEAATRGGGATGDDAGAATARGAGDGADWWKLTLRSRAAPSAASAVGPAGPAAADALAYGSGRGFGGASNLGTAAFVRSAADRSPRLLVTNSTTRTTSTSSRSPGSSACGAGASVGGETALGQYLAPQLAPQRLAALGLPVGPSASASASAAVTAGEAAAAHARLVAGLDGAVRADDAGWQQRRGQTPQQLQQRATAAAGARAQAHATKHAYGRAAAAAAGAGDHYGGGRRRKARAQAQRGLYWELDTRTVDAFHGDDGGDSGADDDSDDGHGYGHSPGGGNHGGDRYDHGDDHGDDEGPGSGGASLLGTRPQLRVETEGPAAD
jgi:hypothetical protein